MTKTPEESPLERAIDEVREDLKDKEYAKNEFYLEILSGGPKLKFPTDNSSQSQVSADRLRQYIEDLELQVRGRRDYRIISRVGPFVDSLQVLMKNCETLFQATPFGVNVVFSGARILLRVSSTLDTYFDTVLDAMERIGRIIVSYEKFASAYGDPQIQRCLVSSYKKIILFWASASHTLAKHNVKSTIKMAFKSIAKPLDREIKKALDGIDKDTRDVQRIAQATEAERTSKDRAERRRKALLEWIMGSETVDTALQLQGQLERRQAGTCTWLFDDPRFNDWHDAKENSILWYNAPPGSGKSVMSSAVVERLLDKGASVAYSFYSFSDPWRRHGLNGLRSLALQLIRILENNGQVIPDRVTNIYENAIKQHIVVMNSAVTAAQVVHELINLCPHVFLVIDGLDECADENQMLSMLDLLLQTRTLGVTKWLFTSRMDHPKIGAIMKKYQASSVNPTPGSISRDIQRFVSATVTSKCEECVTRWIEDFDTSFLYASLICDILRGKDFTCQEEIDQALQEFPPELNKYYIQLLERLATQPEQKQELARRVFLLLVAGLQSVSLRELLNALAIQPGAVDHSKSRERNLKDVKELCMPFIVFDSSGKESEENPVVKLCHKTVQDFFLQGLETLSIRQDLRKFFVTAESAAAELGMNCLTYLQYERYAHPLDLAVSLANNSNEHAFLLYAATFWFQHLQDAKPTPEIDKQVKIFLKSRNFWTCLGVQSHEARYLFARFIVAAKNRHSYTMGIRKPESAESDSLCGLPLPDWFDAYSGNGMVLDRSFCSFAEEWREVLTTYPQGLDLCVPLRQFPESCHLTSLNDKRVIKAAYLEVGYQITEVLDVRLVDVSFSKKTLWADLVYQERGDTSRVKRLLIPLYSPKKKPSPPVSHSLPLIDGWLVSVQQKGEDDVVEAWSIDPQTLQLRYMSKDFSEAHKAPSSLHEDVIGRREGTWGVLATEAVTSSRNTRPTRIFHMAWRPTKKTVQTNDDNGQADVDPLDAVSDEEYDSDDETSSDEESVPETPGPQSDEEHRNSSSEDGSEDGTSSDVRSSETDYGSNSDEGSEVNNCLILVLPNGNPQWYHWSTSPGIRSRVGCAAHPTLPLIAITHTPCQLELMEPEKQVRRTAHLPELSDLRDVPEGSTRELRFSPCGNRLHFLSIAFTSNETNTTCRLTVSTFDFNVNGNVDDTLVRRSQSSSCTYEFADRLCDTPWPLALTHWTDDHVVVALPPLTCDPKIVRVALNDRAAGNGNVSTMCEQIYFPTSTPRRKARLLYRRGIGEKDDCIYLALDALLPECPRDRSSIQAEAAQSPCEGGSPRDRLGQASPPVVLRWKVGAEQRWKEWDDEVDSRSNNMKKEGSLWEILRGGFVESGKSFNVPYRSGLDWTRKGYLSCG